MTACKAIAKLLKLNKILKIVDFRFCRDGSLRLDVKPFNNGARCRECGRRSRLVRRRAVARQWRDLPVAGREVSLGYVPREIMCPTHGRTEEDIPWAARHARVSYRFEYAVLRLCQVMTQKAASELLHMSASTLSDQLHRSIERYVIVCGEFASSASTRCLTTSVTSTRRWSMTWSVRWSCGSARGVAALPSTSSYDHQLSGYQKSQIHTGCCDMSEAYMGAITTHCPNARLVLDRFHVVKALNDAIDEVRKEQWREASAAHRKALKGLRWLLYRHSSTRSRRDTQTLRALEKHNRRIYRAWRLKDEFEQLWNFNAPWAALRFFKRWTTSALRSRLEPLRRFVATAPRHQAGILAFVETRVTNAVAEGLNRIVKIVKNRASGFRHLQPFADMIYLTVGARHPCADDPCNLKRLATRSTRWATRPESRHLSGFRNENVPDSQLAATALSYHRAVPGGSRGG